MDDLISRQVAIEALRRAEALTKAFGYHNVIDTIRELPSAQPEIIRCKDCRYHGANECAHSLALVLSKDNDFCSYAERREDEGTN